MEKFSISARIGQQSSNHLDAMSFDLQARHRGAQGLAFDPFNQIFQPTLCGLNNYIESRGNSNGL